MSIYIRSTHTIYTDQTFLDTLNRSKIWRERDENRLNIKTLADFADEMGYQFVTEIKPNVYYIDGEIVKPPHRSSITLTNHLKDHYIHLIETAVSQYGPKNYTVPTTHIRHLDGILLLKKLKNMVLTEPTRYKNYK